jgi:O-antigen ligase
VAPFVVVPGAVDSFRLPQRMASEWLALASLLALAPLLATVEKPWPRLLRNPALLAVAPLLLLATLSLFTTSHPLHAREALVDLWIGAAALVGWSLAFANERLRRLVDLLLVPAAAFAILGILQLHALWRPLGFYEMIDKERLEVTSLAGNAGDFGIFLVLPCLVAQANLAARRGRAWLQVVALVVCAYGLVGTQTLSAVAALAGGSALLWAARLPRRHLVWVAAGTALVVLALVTVAPRVSGRFAEKLWELRHGKTDALLSGRQDGWRVATRLLAERPLAGFGHGSYRAEFARTKIDLLGEGVPFFEHHTNPSFANAHNEPLEVAAALGWPGLLASLWAFGFAAAGCWRAWRAGRDEAGLRIAGWASLAVLCLVQFPFRMALVGYPWLVFVAWSLAPAPGGEEAT